MLDLLKSIRSRSNRTGVITADRYLRSIEQCFNGGFCPADVFKCASQSDWVQAIKDAESKLCYTADDTRVDTKSICKGDDGVSGIIMQFDAIITTTKSDRDGDILMTAGATVDKDMPLLWQHTPFQPIGKMVRVTEHTDSLLRARFVVADIPLGRDAAVLIEMGALRISHGFEPKEFEPRKDEDEGWLFSEFEIYESSVVSVPSNTDAVITAFSRDKLHTPMVKTWAKRFYDERPAQGKGVEFEAEEPDDDSTHTVVVTTSGPDSNKLMERILQLKAEKNPVNHDAFVTANEYRQSCTCQNKSLVVPYESIGAIEDENREFDFGAALQRLKDWAKGGDEKFKLATEPHREQYRKAFTFVRINGDEFGNYELLHHDIIDGNLATSAKAVRHVIAKVNGAFGGIGESDDDRKAMYDHLAEHMKDFGETPPLFKKNYEVVEQLQKAAFKNGQFPGIEIRKDGRALSEKNSGIVKEAMGDLQIALRGELTDPVRGLIESAVSRLGGMLSQERSFSAIQSEFFAELVVTDPTAVQTAKSQIEKLAATLAEQEESSKWGQLLEEIGVV